MNDITSIHAIAGAELRVAEFEVRMSKILPQCPLKIKIYNTPGEKQLYGYTNIELVRKNVAEFDVWSPLIFPYAKMKVIVYEDQQGVFTGYTDIRLIRRLDNQAQQTVSTGNTIEEALYNTVSDFVKMAREDYPEGEYPSIPADRIEYVEYKDL